MGWGNGTDIHDVLPPYDDKHKPSDTGPAEVGQLVCTVVPDFRHPLSVFDAQRSDQTNHNTISGTIRPLDPQKDFRPKPNRLPVYKVRLGECEELLSIHSKMRPCIVLATADGIPDKDLPPSEVNRARPAFQRRSYLVAPAYSISTPTEPRSIVPTIAARAECLMYPNLVFLPRSGGYLKKDSVARLDRAFWTTLPPPTELYKLGLSPDRKAILFGQLQLLHGEEPGESYREMVALLREELAAEHQTPSS
jgi:hypothetical protein